MPRTIVATPAPSPRLSMPALAHLPAAPAPCGRPRPPGPLVRGAFLRAAARLAGDVAAFLVSLALALAIFVAVVVAVGGLP